MQQVYSKYQQEDQQVWEQLFSRQINNLANKACEEYRSCIQQLHNELNAVKIPSFTRLSNTLNIQTGWKIHVVPGLIPVPDFFKLLAQKRFCSSTWLRSMKQLDYLEEPDMFHDIFGHTPLLINPEYARFMHKFGQLGLTYIKQPKVLLQLQRLYWFTIEFGLIEKAGKLQIYGAGIISSYSETNNIYAQDQEIVPFDLEEIINTDFENDSIQQKYFVIQSFEELFNSLKKYELSLEKQFGIFRS